MQPLFTRSALLIILALSFSAQTSFASIPYKIKSGDTLYSLLKRENFNENQVRQILVKSPLPKKYHLTPGDRYQISANKAEAYLEIKLFSPHDNTSYLFWRRGPKKAGARINKESYEIRPVTVSGRVNGSLLSTLLSKVDSIKVAYRFLDAYTHNYNLKRVLIRGAPFSMTYETLFQNGKYIKPGEVLKTSLSIRGEVVQRELIRFPGGASFVDPNQSQYNRGFYSPVNYQSVSSLFQKRRFHPIKKRRIAHLGVDFALPPGEPVFAAYAGRVIKKGRSRGAGIYVGIRHPNGLESYYNHLRAHRKGLTVGEYVSNGERIGEIGCTGYCTKAHLHFAIKKNNRFVDPLKFIKTYPFSGKQVIEKQMAKARQSSKQI
ncbi:M23 family metallopeptidase [Bdellovibrionales bacterium]|nr:M23 family metallopeptidase [Bdellovibrionales bacterium]